ncbi:hypothetical protein FB451DRAFT_1026796 [Mycena latifolia]|nr:hypothetical protein FB451DRAFT_1026796 [Mycena latifolia]
MRKDQPPEKITCPGLKISFPPGKTPNNSYPFLLHDEYPLPWGYEFSNGSFFLRAGSCQHKFAPKEDAQCKNCTALLSDKTLRGILDRIVNGVHENSRLAFHPMGNLVELNRRRVDQIRGVKLRKLNDSRTIARKMTTIDDHKELTMAIASGKMARVSSVLGAGRRNGAGVRGLVGLCARACEGKYNPAPDQKGIHLSLTLLRLGGTRLAEIGHNALGLPSVSTARRNTVIRPLRASPGMPTLQEIEHNIDACLDAGPDDDGAGPRIVHQILMLDEIATEKRARYDDRTNKVLGICRQHGYRLPLELKTEDDLNTLCEGVREGKAHLAGEATVAALGILTANPREYSARPILFSADCKKESGPEHAVNILRPVIAAIKKKSKRNNITYRLLCAASDGESRRGKAFIMEYMQRPLALESPIFPHLSGLEFMNFLVGQDDMTGDKDAKHGLKCSRNLLMRDAGVEVRDFRITVPIIKEHLRDNGVSPRTINSLLNPNDKQDVILAFSLMKNIWTLPDAPPNSSPLYIRAREALQIFGKLAYCLVMPYICIEMDLDTQLTHLSAAAHLLLDLFVHNNARTRFMPTPTFVNLMIMIKNVYFCVAKTKVDIPEGKFWLILLGTDRLETFFGLIRTAIGTDSNVDLLQLASRGSGLCEVAVIMALHPEWDRAPRRITLPAVGEAGTVLNSKTDHINPPSWKGNTEVSRVTPLTCWIKGRKIIEDFMPQTREVFQRLSCDPRVNILAPFGKLLVEQYDDEDIQEAYNCRTLEQEFPATESMEKPPSEPSYFGDDDLEDAMGVEEPRGGFESHLEVNGTRLSKAKALRLAMAGLTGPRASTDRTRRVASVPCYQSDGIYDSEPQILGEPCLRIDNPICALVRCEAQLFLAIGAVNGLCLGSETVDEINLDLLADSTAKVSFQIMCLVRTTVEDDPSERYDWRWSHDMDGACASVPGRLVQPLNPTLSVRNVGKPTYLFESSELLAYGAALLEQILPDDFRANNIPCSPRTVNFPYRFQGKACFLCEHDQSGREIDLEPQTNCLKCDPPVPLDIKHGQRVLEHCAAHILHDPSLNRLHELCGLCLRPAPMCTFYLRKSNGTYQIDWERSTCLYKIAFQYSIAAKSTLPGSPCSNVPVNCKQCGPKKPAVWKYNLGAHFRNFHRLPNPETWQMDVTIAPGEVDALYQIWDKRQQYPKPRNMKKNLKALGISEQHSSRLALR